MKVVILAGGLGTRISEESVYKPKPMIEIGLRRQQHAGADLDADEVHGQL